MKVTCHKINSGYGTDYGYVPCEVIEVVSLDSVPTIKVKPADNQHWHYPLTAWYRNGEWVLDLD